jgi:hypothetical protein
MNDADQVRNRLGIPAQAQYVVYFDQAAHCDWDWIQTFPQYFQKAYSGYGVNGALLSALQLLAGNGPGGASLNVYSMCEMAYLQEFVSYQQSLGNDVVSQIQALGSKFRIVVEASPHRITCLPRAKAFSAITSLENCGSRPYYPSCFR